MYRVLLVEDEMLVRLGIKNSIPWEKYQMEVAADAENGQTALEKFRELRPDLLITDIRMGGMDGVELIRRVRELDERCGIVVISCLDDFNLLRSIMKYNVLGYLLKASMSLDEADEVLQKARRYLDQNTPAVPEEPDRALPPEELLRAFVVEESLDAAAFAAAWTDAGYPPESALESAVLFCLLPLGDKPVGELGLSFIRGVITENLPGCYVVPLGPDRILAILREPIACTDRRLSRITQMVQSFFDASLRVVTGKLGGRFASLPDELRGLGEAPRYGDGKAPMEPSVRKAIDYLLSHFEEPVSLNTVASHVGLSPNYFSALFKRETGTSYVNYLNDIRIEKAKLLLQNTNDYLYSVSERAGFHTFEHFSQVFKQKTGLNPGEWRRQHSR